MGLKERIVEKAGELGLSPVGVTEARPLPAEREMLSALERAGEPIPFTPADAALRTDPRRVWPEARTIIMVGLPFAVASPPEPRGLTGYLASGTEGPDYHLVLREKLTALDAFIRAEAPKSACYSFVDTGPLIERPLAWRAGLGVWGENTFLLSPKGGPAFFLGGLMLNIPLEPDEPRGNFCLRCGRCRAACPTGAISRPFHLQPGSCLSYLTQIKGEVPHAFRPLLGNRVYGCDTCLVACPLVRKSPRAGAEVDLSEVLSLNRAGFLARFGRTAAGWRGRTVLQRNAAYALGNLGDPAAVPILTGLLNDPRPVLRAAAVWSLGRIGGVAARQVLERHRERETDEEVRKELALALT
ncbi:MAG: epoxyqueuosine reductase [Bacillota bacterium]|jgi:epoxyqueuosine reductase|nr:epoxyqueuosine reductase [Bacillota bacterium]MDK2855845.1 epoxyqueuosine reductase [Bacillota bacterium]MDK2925159.1 epoxyqueuosine reductase [Bacillota bacterium]